MGEMREVIEELISKPKKTVASYKTVDLSFFQLAQLIGMENALKLVTLVQSEEKFLLRLPSAEGLRKTLLKQALAVSHFLGGKTKSELARMVGLPYNKVANILKNVVIEDALKGDGMVLLLLARSNKELFEEYLFDKKLRKLIGNDDELLEEL